MRKKQTHAPKQGNIEGKCFLINNNEKYINNTNEIITTKSLINKATVTEILQLNLLFCFQSLYKLLIRREIFCGILSQRTTHSFSEFMLLCFLCVLIISENFNRRI
jgi:hypothetical protein